MQLWSVMVLAASHHQILTYDLVAKACGLIRPSLGEFLKVVQQYCLQQNLPPLTSIVVSEESGMPGPGCTVTAADLPRAQMRVFEHKWLDMKAPNEKDLAEACGRVPDAR